MDAKPELEARVREIMDKWAASFPDNPFKDFGKGVSFVSVAERPSFLVELRTLYDVRAKPAPCKRQFSDAVPLASRAPDPASVDVWGFPSPLKKEYVTQQAEVDVPNSFRAVSCTTCGGSGTWSCQTCSGSKSINCPDCHGQGKNACEKCIGRGKIPCAGCRGKGTFPGIVKDGKPSPDTPCTACDGAGGRVCESCNASGSHPCAKCQSKGTLLCAACQGQGTQPCQQCGAKGKLLEGLSVRIDFVPRYDRSAVHDPELPEGLLPKPLPEGKLGQRISEAEGETVAAPSLPDSKPYLQAALAGAIKLAEAGKGTQTGPAKILQQKLAVDQVTVFAVVYRYSGKIYDVWLSALDNKALAKESPFKDYAREQAMKALALASQGRHSEAQGMLSKASAMAGEDISLQHAHQASQGSSVRDFLAIHEVLSVAAGLGLMALLASSSGPTHHLFWPVFYFGLGALAAAFFSGLGFVKLKAGWVPGSSLKQFGLSFLLVAGMAAAAAGAFSQLRLPNKYDTQEFQTRVQEHFKGPTPHEGLSAEDQDFLNFEIRIYEPLGVDVSDAKKAIEDSANAAEELKRQMEAQAANDRKKQAEAERVRKEIEAESPKAKKQAKAKKAPAKKKKKGWFGR